MATLFRASTLATMLMDQLMKLTAMDYLHSVLKDPVQRIADLKDSCEVYIQSPTNWGRDVIYSGPLSWRLHTATVPLSTALPNATGLYIH